MSFRRPGTRTRLPAARLPEILGGMAGRFIEVVGARQNNLKDVEAGVEQLERRREEASSGGSTALRGSSRNLGLVPNVCPAPRSRRRATTSDKLEGVSRGAPARSAAAGVYRASLRSELSYRQRIAADSSV